MKKLVNQSLLVAILASSVVTIAHKGEKHKNHKMHVTQEEKSNLVAINEQYLKEIKPIFQNKCFDCHGVQTKFPWYQKLPGVKQYIQNDIDESKEHIDMSSDFPFKSHSSPEEDLQSIQEAIKKNEMPPLPLPYNAFG